MTQTFINTLCILSLLVPIQLIVMYYRVQIVRWFRRTWTKERILDFFCNAFEHVADDVEQY